MQTVNFSSRTYSDSHRTERGWNNESFDQVADRQIISTNNQAFFTQKEQQQMIKKNV